MVYFYHFSEVISVIEPIRMYRRFCVLLLFNDQVLKGFTDLENKHQFSKKS